MRTPLSKGSTPYVSTGSLPADARIEDLLRRAHDELAGVGEGELSTVYPALAGADRSHFGLALADVGGSTFEAGDSQVPFLIMSVSKPFVLALVCEAIGAQAIDDLVGMNATGLPFNSMEPVDRAPRGRTNPMVNSGAIATTSMVPGDGFEKRWEFVRDGLCRFAGRDLRLDADTVEAVRATNLRNRSLALLLKTKGALWGDPQQAVELYTDQCCLEVTALDLAVMGATLADGGVNPLTGEQVVGAEATRVALVAMGVAGLYETSGEWMLQVGVPGKSGIGGGITASSPGKGGFGAFSPLLDAQGNSVRAGLAARLLSRELGLDILRSAPAKR
ncbi:Glutaminase 1 [Acidipropionibacterium jensenii]|uniref:Glutaminase n=1 Tax=Acidipropionibacterium jensenii TaxID=1749 RepID=A0A448NZ19_9ACTN|nr:glutaminase A [Acidipropionibacterium jensenii]MDN6557290.1 glutaminase A [Acidipropionibacterium acidipropionici]VEI03204.1 Glutaminase 1 [Acidipropionibacterium jensenii]